MSLRTEFIHLVELKNANLSELCRRFGISRKTGYKWLQRSRRPHHSPRRSPVKVEEWVVGVRREHPA